MRSSYFHQKRRLKRAGAFRQLLSLVLTSGLAVTPMAWAAEQHGHQGSTEQAAAKKVIYREGGAVLHDRMMDEIKRQQEFIGKKGGYSIGANGHMMQQGVLLVADDPDKVSVTGGQRCPASAPVKDYHVTAINIEITLSRFLDYFPGYMYVLNENLDKARAEETANKEAREKENTPAPCRTVCRVMSSNRSSSGRIRVTVSS